MRYRMEVINHELVIRNVETDIQLGTVIRHWKDDPSDPSRQILSGWTILNQEGVSTGRHAAAHCLGFANYWMAIYENDNGYPGFKKGARNPDTHRIEWCLGKLLADAVAAIARALIEYQSGGSKAETNEECARLIVQLYAIWFASRFDSFDDERRTFDPYFANDIASDPRLSFADAAQLYGLLTLRERFPDETDTTLKQVLSWPLELLGDLLDRLYPLDVKTICG